MKNIFDLDPDALPGEEIYINTVKTQNDYGQLQIIQELVIETPNGNAICITLGPKFSFTPDKLRAFAEQLESLIEENANKAR